MLLLKYTAVQKMYCRKGEKDATLTDPEKRWCKDCWWYNNLMIKELIFKMKTVKLLYTEKGGGKKKRKKKTA